MVRCEEVKATRFVRMMQGGSRPRLLETDSGAAFVVKFRNNPQGRRILINEFLSSVFLQKIGVMTPAIAIVLVADDFREAGDGSCGVSEHYSRHFGSRYPNHSSRVMLERPEEEVIRSTWNRDHFLGALVCDKWLGNLDQRQAIFYRATVNDPAQGAARVEWVASMIDHGGAFCGARWKFRNDPLQGLYHRRAVYERVRSLDDFGGWIDRVVSFGAGVIEEAVKLLPPEWVEDDGDALDNLMEELLNRGSGVAEMIWKSRKEAQHLFPNWRTSFVVSRISSSQTIGIPMRPDAKWRLPFRITGKQGLAPSAMSVAPATLLPN